MGLLGILLGLGLLVWLAFRGWSVLGLAPVAALIAAAFVGRAAARALDADLHGLGRGLHRAVLSAVPARRAVRQADGRQRLGQRDRAVHDRQLGPRRAILAVVLAGALVTYGGVSLFVAMFVLAPMGQALFRAADIPNRLLPGGGDAGHGHLHDVGAAGHAGDPERDPDAVLRHHAVRRAGPRASSRPASCSASACGG